ncbi:hypothetical protein J6590_081643 [Homalodisca vitripennis]|nr:hypothetical protein J6590_081643 [Homalodisca vitripennis]
MQTKEHRYLVQGRRKSKKKHLPSKLKIQLEKGRRRNLRISPSGSVRTLLVRPSEGKSYSDEGEIRRKAKLAKIGTIIKGLMNTRGGDLIKSAFSSDLQSIVGSKATVCVVETQADAGSEGPGLTRDRGGEVKTFFSKVSSRGEKLVIFTLGTRGIWSCNQSVWQRSRQDDGQDHEDSNCTATDRFEGQTWDITLGVVTAGRINKRYSSSANDLLYRFASERGFHILLLSEQVRTFAFRRGSQTLLALQ